jgi:hypothetical protein
VLRDYEGARHSRSTYFLGFSGPLEDPFLCDLPVLVEGEEAGLTATLDELIWLCNELGRLHPRGEVAVGRDGPGLGIPLYLCDLGRGEDERGVLGVSKVGMRGGCAFEPISQQELGVVLADGCGDGQERAGRDGDGDGEGGRTFGGHDGGEQRTEWLMMGLYRHHNNLF